MATVSMLSAVGPQPRKQHNLHPTTYGDDLMWVVKNVEWTLIIPTAGSVHCIVRLTGAVQGRGLNGPHLIFRPTL